MSRCRRPINARLVAPGSLPPPRPPRRPERPWVRDLRLRPVDLAGDDPGNHAGITLSARDPGDLCPACGGGSGRPGPNGTVGFSAGPYDRYHPPLQRTGDALRPFVRRVR